MSTYEIKNIDHLGLVSGFCQDVGLIDFIDKQFPNQDTNKNLSYGQCLQAMILNGLGYTSQTLYLQSQFFEDKATQRLLGKNVKPEHINDDVLGRCLDKLYEFGVSKLYMGLAEHVVDKLGLKISSHHLDSTSFHTDGAYEQATEDDSRIKIVQGYSRDHRPELNQVILNLITENQAGIPLYMKAASGNSSDKTDFQKIIKAHLTSLKAAHSSPYFIMDSAGYTKHNLIYFNEQQRYLVSRVPGLLVEAKELIQSTLLSDFICLENGYHGFWHNSGYAGVPQRWLLLFSEQAFDREVKTLDKQMHKQAELCRKSLKKLKAQSYACEADAQKAINKWNKSQKYHQVCDILIEKKGRYTSKGKPKKDKDYDFFEYFIQGELYTLLERRNEALKTKGKFIIATNDIDSSLSMQGLLDLYKSQQKVERGFRFLKSPEFLTASFYLKKPERIEALLMVMTCCLMVYAGLEHKIRTQLKENDLQFPNQKKKSIQNPTARWVFFSFMGIHLLSIAQEQQIVVNLQEKHEIILQALGTPYDLFYS